jgi:hypothetical protein
MADSSPQTTVDINNALLLALNNLRSAEDRLRIPELTPELLGLSDH